MKKLSSKDAKGSKRPAPEIDEENQAAKVRKARNFSLKQSKFVASTNPPSQAIQQRVKAKQDERSTMRTAAVRERLEEDEEQKDGQKRRACPHT